MSNCPSKKREIKNLLDSFLEDKPESYEKVVNDSVILNPERTDCYANLFWLLSYHGTSTMKGLNIMSRSGTSRLGGKKRRKQKKKTKTKTKTKTKNTKTRSKKRMKQAKRTH